jgi:hypothetical protein
MPREAGKVCSYNPFAFPPSMAVRCTGATCLSPWTSSPASSSTLPLAMPHPTSPAHRPDPELQPIHAPHLANSRSSPPRRKPRSHTQFRRTLSACSTLSSRAQRLSASFLSIPSLPDTAELRRLDTLNSTSSILSIAPLNSLFPARAGTRVTVRSARRPPA